METWEILFGQGHKVREQDRRIKLLVVVRTRNMSLVQLSGALNSSSYYYILVSLTHTYDMKFFFYYSLKMFLCKNLQCDCNFQTAKWESFESGPASIWNYVFWTKKNQTRKKIKLGKIREKCNSTKVITILQTI